MVKNPKLINIDLDQIKKIAKKGVRRSALFMGLGLNAAYDENFQKYELTDITQIQIIRPNADSQTLKHYKEEFSLWIISCGLRELIETFAVFLDEINNSCILMAVNKRELSFRRCGKI